MTRIAIVGAGAVGGYVGGFMARDGRDVTLIDAWPAHIEKIRADGLRLEGATPEDCFTTRPQALHINQVESLSRQEPIDIAIVSTKSYDTEWATMLARPLLSPQGFVVSLQNSINEERIAALVGWGKVVGCIASSIAVELEAPGLIRRNAQRGGDAYTVFRAGEPHGRITPRLEQFVDMVKSADSAKATSNLWGERWSKLVINSMRNGMAAVTGLCGNENDRREMSRRLAIRLAGEGVKVGRALGYDIEPILKLNPDKFVAAAEGGNEALGEVEEVILEQTKRRGEGQRPSMGQDMIKGRKTEIEFLNGLVAAKGREVGIPTPVNDKMVALVKKVERGDLKPDPDNIRGI